MEVTVRAASPGPSSRMVRYSGAESLTPQQTAFRTRCSTCRISERCHKSEVIAQQKQACSEETDEWSITLEVRAEVHGGSLILTKRLQAAKDSCADGSSATQRRRPYSSPTRT